MTPTPDALWAARTTRVAAAWDSLPPEVRIVLTLCDGTRALPTLSRLSPLPTELTARIVERLAAEGLIESRDDSRVRRATPHALAAWLTSPAAAPPAPPAIAPAPTPRRAPRRRPKKAAISPASDRAAVAASAFPVTAEPGLLTPALASAKALAAAGIVEDAFSPDEEAFFSRPIEPEWDPNETWSDLASG